MFPFSSGRERVARSQEILHRHGGLSSPPNKSRVRPKERHKETTGYHSYECRRKLRYRLSRALAARWAQVVPPARRRSRRRVSLAGFHRNRRPISLPIFPLLPVYLYRLVAFSRQARG